MKVAVVHNTFNRFTEGVINHFGQICPEHYSTHAIAMVAESLQAAGHTVACIPADKDMLSALERFMPPGRTGQPTGIVFNMAYGIQGECRYTHVPAMLEMAGVPYTGSGPLGHALALDKIITKLLIQQAGVPTPAFRVMHDGDEPTDDLRFPLIVKPRHESTSFGLTLVSNHGELAAAVQALVETYEQEALVEEYIDGREITIGLLGHCEVEFLPPVELDFGQRDLKLNTWDDKLHNRLDEPDKICPAPLGEDLAMRLQNLALATFRACHLRDYARVDIRLDAAGEPFVLEVNSMASLGDTGSYMTAAMAAGYSFESLVNRILDLTHQRYFGRAIPSERRQTAPSRERGDRVPDEIAIATGA